MSLSDSDSPNMRTRAEDRSLVLAGKNLVHDVATPLATLQLNLQVLSSYLPILLRSYTGAADQTAQISESHLLALGSLPEAIDADIRKIRHAVKLFSSTLIPANPVMPVGAEAVASAASSMRVLLVEDEAIHQEIALKQFSGQYEVDVAATAEEALNLVQRGAYDVILLDFMLSGQEVGSLMGNLRANSGDARIVLVSNMPLHADEVRELNVHGVLEKPFRLISLQALLQNT